MKYVIPKKKHIEKFIRRGYLLIWEPILILEYICENNKNLVAFDVFFSDVLRRPKVRLMLCRSAKKWKFSDNEPYKGIKLQHIGTKEMILSDLKRIEGYVESHFESSITKFREKLYRDLGKYRRREAWQFGIPAFTEEVQERSMRSAFAEFISAFREIRIPDVVFMREVLREGLKIKSVEKIVVLSEVKAYYPIMIDLMKFEVYEPMLNGKKSISYSTLFKNEEVKKIITNVISSQRS